MKVFIAGTTGVLGSRLVQKLSERGHDVVGLARDQRGEEIVRLNGGHPRHARLKLETAWAPQYPSYRQGLAQVIAAWKE